jgi:hypothetical protein
MGDQTMTAAANPPTPRAQQLEPPGDLPITPPQSPRLELDNKPKDSKISLSTTGSRRSTRSHQEYLDSLKPPSDEEFALLAKVQEECEKEHRRRNQSLQNQSANLAYKSMEARHDFAEAQHQQQQQHQHRLQNVIAHAHAHAHLGGRAAAEPGAEDSSESLGIQSRAATLIQRSYRGYRVRREMKGLGLDAGTRWTHAIRDAQWKQLNEPRPRGNSSATAARISNTDMTEEEEEQQQQQQQQGGGAAPRSSSTVARQNWRKAAKIAMRAGGDEDSSHSDDDSDSSSDEGSSMSSAEQRAAEKQKRALAKEKRRKKARMMGLQYFLEMVDLKHRYGSNLRQYHEEWKRADTNENFFYWLDYGDGRNIELATCPRERLDREQVRYLSREERQNYLVKVDSEGRLCWAKNGVRIDTTEQWKDSINGIVPVDDDTPAFAPSIESQSQSNGSTASENTSSEASESELEAARAAKYATPSLDDAKGLRKVKHVSAATIFNKLLRKSVRKNTWIFVADTSFRLYVGIKASGSFQHSSFLQGSRISAAGLIKIKNGRLTSLSPLSGHYRPPASSFRAFVHGLRDQGVDMHRVSISKSYAVLVGLEAYTKTRAKGREALRRATRHKERLLDPELAARRADAEQDKTRSAALERRAVEREHRVEEEERRRDENRAGVKLLLKLGLRPREPPVQQKKEEEASAA